jgi:intraflagellar transport protein 140
MSLFSETRVPIDNEVVTAVAVSNVAMNPSLAVTTKSKIMLFNENGEKHDYELSRNISATFIEWHPSLPILAIGW